MPVSHSQMQIWYSTKTVHRCSCLYIFSPAKVDAPFAASSIPDMLSSKNGGSSGKKSMPAKCWTHLNGLCALFSSYAKLRLEDSLAIWWGSSILVLSGNKFIRKLFALPPCIPSTPTQTTCSFSKYSNFRVTKYSQKTSFWLSSSRIMFRLDLVIHNHPIP